MHRSPPDQPRSAVIFFTHVFDRETRAAFAKLERESGGRADLYVLTDTPDHAPPLTAGTHRFDFTLLLKNHPGSLGNRLVPGNGHLPVISFYRDHPAYDYYWVIEYDVRFTGSWRDFFSALDTSTADLLATHIRRYEDEPEWFWWQTLQAPESLAGLTRLRAFMPLYRISRAALTLLSGCAGGSWRGHYECLVPSLLGSCGLRLEDIGGDGPFTPPGRTGRFYTTFPFRGHLRHFGTMRHRPPFVFWGSCRDCLYHPVKSGTGGWRAGAVNAMLCLGYCLKHLLSAHGHVFLKDLMRHWRLWFLTLI